VAPCGKVFSRPDAIERHKKRTKCSVCNGGVVVDDDVVELRVNFEMADTGVVEGVAAVQVIDMEGIVAEV
jgi:hypothetical protein